MFYFQRPTVLRVKNSFAYSMRPLHLFCAVIGFCVPVNSVRGEMIDELKGLSLDVVWTQQGRFITPPETAWRIELSQKQTLQAYISAKGNIFEYETFTDAAGHNFKSHRIAGLDKGVVFNAKNGLMYT